jgi:siroheme synthase (precorrin-2 oxidase/ferrochelatase)
MAIHRAGDLTIGVSAGRVPGAAARIRDAIAARFDQRFGTAIAKSRTVRERVFSNEDRAQWHQIASRLLDSSFCESVESGTFDKRVSEWL